MTPWNPFAWVIAGLFTGLVGLFGLVTFSGLGLVPYAPAIGLVALVGQLVILAAIARKKGVQGQRVLWFFAGVIMGVIGLPALWIATLFFLS